jgi:hypothetical protein
LRDGDVARAVTRGAVELEVHVLREHLALRGATKTNVRNTFRLNEQTHSSSARTNASYRTKRAECAFAIGGKNNKKVTRWKQSHQIIAPYEVNTTQLRSQQQQQQSRGSITFPSQARKQKQQQQQKKKKKKKKHPSINNNTKRTQQKTILRTKNYDRQTLALDLQRRVARAATRRTRTLFVRMYGHCIAIDRRIASREICIETFVCMRVRSWQSMCV